MWYNLVHVVILFLQSWTFEGPLFKLDIQNLYIFNFIKISAQVTNIFSKIQQNKKYFNLCQNLSSTMVSNVGITPIYFYTN
jgi:hypothetical protein